LGQFPQNIHGARSTVLVLLVFRKTKDGKFSAEKKENKGKKRKRKGKKENKEKKLNNPNI
jgi:hypothetical protein